MMETISITDRGTIHKSNDSFLDLIEEVSALCNLKESVSFQ